MTQFRVRQTIVVEGHGIVGPDDVLELDEQADAGLIRQILAWGSAERLTEAPTTIRHGDPAVAHGDPEPQRGRRR